MLRNNALLGQFQLWIKIKEENSLKNWFCNGDQGVWELRVIGWELWWNKNLD